MKNLTMYALVLGMSTTLSFGTGATTCTGLPTSQNQTNNEITNNSAAIDIINLSGTDCAGNDVNQFKIIKLPDPQSGILYMADGVTPVEVGQTLTRAQADGLKFDPKDGYQGTVSFTYAAISDDGQGNDATISLPIVASGNGGNGNGNGGNGNGNGGNGNGGNGNGGNGNGGNGNGGNGNGGNGNGGAHPGGGICTEPSTEDLNNRNLPNTLPAVNILNLSGHDCADNEVKSFEIKTLPAPESGILYMADGKTPVRVGQVLTREEADGLRFDPAADFVGNATFTYVAIDDNGVKDLTPATVSLPVVSEAGACTEPITDDKDNPRLLNTLGAVNILNLSGHDCAGHEVESFEIKTLPDPKSGILYMADGVTPVRVGQVLTREEADGLRFDPADGFVGDAIFTYVAIDENTTTQDLTPATVTIPVVANGGGNGGGNADCTCDDYESSVPSNTPFGLLLMFLATLFVARKSFK